jgi:altronate hydrolase
VVALTHGTGCGMDSDGLGLQILQRTLTGYATHPNFAGVLVVGLGCESNQINAWLAHGSLREGETLRVFSIQDTGGTAKTVAKGIAMIKEMLPQANAVKREPCSAAHITIGLQCGGSDGYSGISANPALGAAVDLLVAHGGTAILSETPEIYGAEHLLTRRAVRPDIAEKLISRIKWWEHYTEINEGEMNNNPSPGNKAGGLTTILEKSLGAVAKGGTSNLEAVYEYAEPVGDARLCLYGHTRLRPGERHGPGGRRRQHHLLYHRPRLGLRLRALAFAEAGHQLGAVAAAGRRHGHQLRRDHRRRRLGARDGAAHFRDGAGHGIR